MRSCRMKKKDSELVSYLLVTAGTFFMAAGINIIYEPLSMVTGGFSGIGIILKKVLEAKGGFSLPVGVTNLFLNLPLFILAMRLKGGRFLKRTLYAALCFSVALLVVPSFENLHKDYLMAAIYGGVLNGVGLGLVFSRNTSTGGSDLLSTLLNHWFPGLSISELLIIIDGAIVLGGMFFFGMQTGMYSIVAVFITGKVSDALLDGLKFAKMAYIISDSPTKISEEVMRRLDRGVTGLSGKGMYSGKDKNVLLCVVSKKEVVRLIEIVKNADENAFIIVMDAKEVQGEGFIEKSVGY